MSDDRDQLTLDRRLWWLPLFGAVPLANGIIFLVVSTVVWAAGAPVELRLLFPLFGGGLFAVGILLVFGRWDTLIDRERRIVVRRWGLFGWWRERAYGFGEPACVELRRERLRGGAGPEPYFTVALRSEGRRVPIPLVRPAGETAARSAAERIAAFLKVGVEQPGTTDRTTYGPPAG